MANAPFYVAAVEDESVTGQRSSDVFCCTLFLLSTTVCFLSDPLSSSVLCLIFLSASDSCFAASQRAAHLGVIPLPVTVESKEPGLLSVLNM